MSQSHNKLPEVHQILVGRWRLSAQANRETQRLQSHLAVQSAPVHIINHDVSYKKFELMFTRCAKAYSSYRPTTVK